MKRFFLFLIVFTAHQESCAMLEEYKIAFEQRKVAQEVTQFIDDFAGTKFKEVYAKYCDQKQLIAKIVSHKRNDAYFYSVITLATRCPLETQKLVITSLFNDHISEQTMDMFMNMPIARALEWHAWCEQASRGKMIYLPIFEQKFKERKIVFDEILCIEKTYTLLNTFSARQVAHRQFDGEWIIKAKDEVAFSLHILARLKEYEGRGKILKSLTGENLTLLKGKKLSQFLDILIETFFLLSMQEVQLLLSWQQKDRIFSRKELEILGEIDKKIKFFNEASVRCVIRNKFLSLTTLSTIQEKIKSKESITSMAIIPSISSVFYGLAYISNIMKVNNFSGWFAYLPLYWPILLGFTDSSVFIGGFLISAVLWGLAKKISTITIKFFIMWLGMSGLVPWLALEILPFFLWKENKVKDQDIPSLLAREDIVIG